MVLGDLGSFVMARRRVNFDVIGLDEMNGLCTVTCCMAVCCLAQPEACAQSRTEPYGESPTAVFDTFRTAFESGEWKLAVDNFSPAKTRIYAFETLFAAGQSSDSIRDTYNELAEKYGIDFEALAWSLESEVNGEISVDIYVDAMLSAATDQEAFLAEALPYFLPRRPRYEKQLRDLDIDGDRARAIATRISFGWSRQLNGDTIRITYRSDEPVFFRKYGDRWRLCVEGEWKNADYKHVIR